MDNLIYFGAIKAFDRTTHKSIVIFNYQTKEIEYISKNLSFFCEDAIDKFRNLGFSFYLKSIKKEDIELFKKVKIAFSSFLDRIPAEHDKCCYTMCYTIRLQNKRPIHSFLIHHKITPILIDDKGHIHKVLCVLSLSGKREHNKISIYNENDAWEFDSNKLFWKKKQKITLSDQEKEVIYLSAQGYNVKEVAKLLFIAPNTVKFHQKNIFEKTGTNNITEILNYLIDNRVF